VLARPETLVEQRAAEVTALRDRAGRSLEHRVRRADDEMRHTLARLRALSPLATLQRGYAVLQDADGHVVTSVAQAAAGAAVSVRIADGRIHATTDRVEADALSTTDPQEDPDE
jgi:exodeoxyribonuclease VII large subunit